MIVPHPSWDALLPALSGTIYLIGPGNCGKTTLARWLSDRCGEDAALLDGDAGQPTLGPPGTLGLSLHGQGRLLKFVGALTPSMALPATLVSLRLLLDAAYAAGAATVIVDPCGYVGGEGGREFQRRSIEVLRPDHIVAVGRDAEIDAVLAIAAGRSGLSVHRLPVSPHARRRSQAARRRYREDRLAAWLADARLLVPDGVARAGFFPARPEGYFAGLCDGDGWLLTAGVILQEKDSEVYLAAPSPLPGRPAYIDVGRFRPGPGPLPPGIRKAV
ncbi:MAG: polynucleotide 5-hydroxyl-kinase [Methanofollis sp.]|nr:polynucleotide 5-hydroxyl-kinase [Methanofollis sp.]